MKKQQRISLLISGDYADLIIPELSYQIWNKYRIRTKIIDHSFTDNTTKKIDILFMGSNEIVPKIESAIRTEYQLLDDF